MNKKKTIKEKKESQGPLLLSVALSCKGVEAVLKKNLISLSRQDLSRSLWEPVFLLKEELKHSVCPSLIQEHFPSPRFLFLPKGSALYKMRNLAFQHLKSSYIYFLDEDVILENPSHLSHLVQLHKRQGQKTVIGAGYLEAEGCSFWGRSYNWISRLWVKNQIDFIPAGNLSVKTEKPFRARFYTSNPFGFGGEEMFFLHTLKEEGHKILCSKELSAPHLAQHNFIIFIKRAWIQGSSLSCDRVHRKTNYLLFFREKAPLPIKFVSLFYLLLVRLSAFFYKVFPS